MGLNIGGVTGSLASLRSSPDFAQVRLGAQRDPVTLPGVRQADDDGRGPFFRRQGPPQIQVGFGRGLSPQGAALRTISATIENTRRTIPTIKEIRERFIIASSARRDQAQRVVTERTERTLTRRVESRIPEASAQARNFGGGLDEIRAKRRHRSKAPRPKPRPKPQSQPTSKPMPPVPRIRSTTNNSALAPPKTRSGSTSGSSPSHF